MLRYKVWAKLDKKLDAVGNTWLLLWSTVGAPRPEGPGAGPLMCCRWSCRAAQWVEGAAHNSLVVTLTPPPPASLGKRKEQPRTGLTFLISLSGVFLSTVQMPVPLQTTALQEVVTAATELCSGFQGHLLSA